MEVPMNLVSRSTLQAALASLVVLLAAIAALAQVPQNLTFEVATIKPFDRVALTLLVQGRSSISMGKRGGPGTDDPGQITWPNVNLKTLITTAFDVKPYQVTGPAWLDTERFAIVAKVPQGATKEQVNVMWQNLLAERYGMVARRESKEFSVRDLVVAKGGAKLKESILDPTASDTTARPKIDMNGVPQLSAPGIMSMSGLTNGPYGYVAGKARTMAQLADWLGTQVGSLVRDKTDLTAQYDFLVELPSDLREGLPLPTPGAMGPEIVPFIEQQLGLRLISGKAMLDDIIIEKISKTPTDN